MRVSVVSTVLNEAGSLPRLLDSLAAQTQPPDEVVVCDGGSTDGTLPLLEAESRLSLRVVRRPGANISQGRNAAIEAATGEVIAVTDPAGKRTVLRPQVKGGYAEATFTATNQPGMYQVRADAAFSNRGGFGVNLDVKESELQMAAPDKIEGAAATGLLTFVDGPKRSIVEEVKRTREGEEFWPLLFKLAVLIFMKVS